MQVARFEVGNQSVTITQRAKPIDGHCEAAVEVACRCREQCGRRARSAFVSDSVLPLLLAVPGLHLPGRQPLFCSQAIA
jgi:hypothetical protein